MKKELQSKKGGTMNQAVEPTVMFKPLQDLWEHDIYTFQHSLRVADILRRFGEFLNLPPIDQEDLYKLGALHDIGKTKIPRNTLIKTKQLTKDEWEMLKEHPLVGYNMMIGEGYSSKVLSGLLYHHENMDGSGYPFGCEGTRIPLFAKMLRIVDTYDAMTNERSYQKASTISEAMDELFSLKGHYYDPDLVKDFKRMLVHKLGNDSLTIKQANGTILTRNILS